MSIIKAGKYRFNDELEGLSSFKVAIPFCTDTTPEFLMEGEMPSELSVANTPLHFNTIEWYEVMSASGRWFSLKYTPNETFAEMFDKAIVHITDPAIMWDKFYDEKTQYFAAILPDLSVSEALKGFGQTITITEDTEVDDTFAQWFTANTKAATSTKVKITYNGIDVEIGEGQTATLKCAGKKMKSDVTIKVG